VECCAWKNIGKGKKSLTNPRDIYINTFQTLIKETFMRKAPFRYE
jgi:hypothetical protein